MRDFFTRLPVEVQDPWLASGRRPGPAVLPDLAALCGQTGFAQAEVADIEQHYTFRNVEAWWAFQWTHGARGFLMALAPDAVVDMEAETGRRLAPMLQPGGEVPMNATMPLCRATA